MNLKELRDARAQKQERMQALHAAAAAEKRALTAAEATEFDGLETEIRGLGDQIRRAEVAEENARALAGAAGTRNNHNTTEERDLAKFSYTKLFREAMTPQGLTGLELEMNQQGLSEQRAAGVEAQGNVVIPQLILTRAGQPQMHRRDLTATGQTSAAGDQGGLTIHTEVGSVIDRLRAKLMVGQMGATMLDGLVGNITFPKFVSDDQAVEKAENATSAESSPTFGSVSLSPKRLPVHVEVSRQLLMQSSASVEAMLRNDLAYQIAAVMDRRALNGSGSSNQPTGVLNTSGIGSVAGGTNGAAPTWANIVALETLIATADADLGALGYLTNPKVRGKLKTTQKFDSTNGMPVWEAGTEPLNGYRAGVTTQVPSTLTKGSASGVASAIIFGNWADLLLGQWGGLEFLVNPYAKDTEGLIRINAWTFFDAVVRRAESFAAMKDALTT